MQILHSLYNNEIKGPTAITVGKFDGIHKGHELLTSSLLEQEKRGYHSLVLTFDHSPRIQLGKDLNKLLVTNEERVAIMNESKISYLVECSFENEIKDLEAEAFISLLVNRFHMKYFICGTDFRFGKMGKGDIALLKELSARLDFELEIIDKLQYDHRDISSTYIREEILKGNVANANFLLGYPYFVWGQIVHGNHLGSKMGMPTINIYPPEDKMLPENGVYITKIIIDNHTYHGITNVGVKPTVGKDYQRGIETHILDFNENVYEKTAKVIFLEHLRKEMKFQSIEELFQQMRLDKKEAISYFNKK